MKSARLNIRLTKKQKESIRLQAWREHITMSDLIKMWIREELREAKP